MKTIEERAEEYAKELVPNTLLMRHNVDKRIGVKKGYIKGRQEERAEWQEKVRWIPIDEEKPNPQKRVWIKVIDRHGKEHTLLALYVPPKTVLASDFMLEDDSEGEEYDEVINDYYVIEGWWEYQYEAETHWYIRDKVTHWREIIE